MITVYIEPKTKVKIFGQEVVDKKVTKIHAGISVNGHGNGMFIPVNAWKQLVEVLEKLGYVKTVLP
jgi:hypothetical protein